MFTRHVTATRHGGCLQSFLLRWWSRSGSHDIDHHAPLHTRGTMISDAGASPPASVGPSVAWSNGPGVASASGHGGASARHLVAGDPRCPSLHLHRGAVPHEPVWRRAIRSVLPKVQHVTILIPPSEITDLNGVWRRRREFIDRITRGNPHTKKLHVYTLADKGCVGTDPTYVHSKMAVIDDDLLLIGSTNCNHHGWETDTELVGTAWTPRTRPVQHGAQAPDGAVATTRLSLRASFATRSCREASGTPPPHGGVCAYDPSGGTDRGRQYSAASVEPRQTVTTTSVLPAAHHLPLTHAPSGARRRRSST